MRRAGGILAAALLAAAVAGCGGPGQEPEIEVRVPVSVDEAGVGNVEDRVVATGTLRAPEAVALRADTGGALRIATDAAGRRLREGARVEAGQLIAEITGEEVRLAARTDANYQRYVTAKRDFESQKRLFEDGLLSESAFRQVESTLADARLEWERSQWTEARSKLVTPIAGVVLELARDDASMPLADGQLVTQGFVVAQVAPVETLVAEVDLVGPDVTKVEVGQAARVRYHALDREFPGTVSHLAPSIDPLTRTLRAEVDVDNEAGMLRPGMFVEVVMVAERREGVTVVPRNAVVERSGKKVVFVVRGQAVNARDVVLGLGDDDVVEIRNGLEAGERIVVRGVETLKDGSRVRVTSGA